MVDEPWTHHEADLGSVRLHYVEMGEGPLVVLLHGFPEFWYSWRHQIPALAAAGFRVVAPDMRGYGLSSRPRGPKAYRLDRLVDDVAALIAFLGCSKAAIVGHDWGGFVAWSVPAFRPEVVDRLAVLNAPHFGVMLRKLLGTSQLLRSWYIFFFLLPWLPEALLSGFGWAAIGRIFKTTVNPAAFSPEDIARYKAEIARPGALSAALAYYRALPWLLLPGFMLTLNVAVPTLLIWGDEDPILGTALTKGLEAWVPDLRVEHVARAGHWVQNDAPVEVNRLLLDFLKHDSLPK